MLNPRITPQEFGLIKGALRRIFSRSLLRESIMQRVRVEHYSAKRPRVKKWGYCEKCGEVTPEWQLEVDHISPVVPLHLSLKDLTLLELVDRIWCPEDNFQILCLRCHELKTTDEGKIRTEHKRKKKNGK